MSINKSLKTKGKLTRPRNVYTRTERIKILKAEGKWQTTMSVFGIPKVKAAKAKRKGKAEKKVAKAEATTAAAATPATGGTASAPAAGKEKAKK